MFLTGGEIEDQQNGGGGSDEGGEGGQEHSAAGVHEGLWNTAAASKVGRDRIRLAAIGKNLPDDGSPEACAAKSAEVKFQVSGLLILYGIPAASTQ
ncbi:MAG: hypothetical protein V4625_08135 [Pseudomonadota bacterium]